MRTTEELNGLINQLEAEVQSLPVNEQLWHLKRGELAKAQIDLSDMLMEKSPSLALALLRSSAENGNANAQCKLGFKCAVGEGLPQNDSDAVNWWSLSANQGNAQAQFNLGLLYAEGRGLPQNCPLAVHWYELSIQQGFPGAQNNLGVLYFNGGRGLPRDLARALYWFRLAAQRGEASGQNNLGGMYQNGRGVPQDYVMAAHFCELSANQGSTHAQKRLGQFAEDLKRGIRHYQEDDLSDYKEWISDATKKSDIEFKAQLQERAKYGSVKVFFAIAEEWLKEASSDEERESRKAFVKKLIDKPEKNAQKLLHVAHAQKSWGFSSLFKSKANYVPPNWELVFKFIETFGADPNVVSRDPNTQYPLLICYAAAFEEKHILQKLMELGGDYQGLIDKESALMAAICGNKPENIDLLLEKGFSCSNLLFPNNHPEYQKKLLQIQGPGFNLQFAPQTFTDVAPQAENVKQVEYSRIPHEFALQISESNYFTKKASIINSLISILRDMENPERDRIKKEFNIPDELLKNDSQVKPSPKYDSLFQISIHKWEAELSSAREKLSLIKNERLQKTAEEAKASEEAEKNQKKARDSALTNLKKIIAELNVIRIPAGAELSPQLIISIIELAANLDTEVSALEMLKGALPVFTISGRKIKEYRCDPLMELEKNALEIEKNLKTEIAVLSVTEADPSETFTREEKRLSSLIQGLEEKIASIPFQIDEPSAEVWCEMRGQLAKLQYHLFCLLEKKKPLEAVRLLWASFKIGYQPARTRLLDREAEASDSLLPEALDALTEEVLFERGLQALAGVGVASNHCQANAYFEAAALKGHAPSQYLIGMSYEFAAWGRNKDYVQARHYYTMSVEKGEALAESNLGIMFKKGLGAEENSPIAFKLLLASARKGSSAALYALGVSYREGFVNYTLAARCFRLSSKQGNEFALFALGEGYIEGKGIDQSGEEALKCFIRAAELGNAAAHTQLGLIYFKGNLVPVDYSKALLYFGKAADKGSVRGASNLAVMYVRGTGVKQDLAMANYFFRKICDKLKNAETELDQEVLNDATKKLEAISVAVLKETIEEYKKDDVSEYWKQISREPKKSDFEIRAQLHIRAENASPEVFIEIAENWLRNSPSDKEKKSRESFVKEKAQYLLAHTKNNKALEAKLIDEFGAKPEIGGEKEKYIQALEKALDELNVVTEQFNSRAKGDLRGMKPDLVAIAGPLQDLMEGLCKKESDSLTFGSLMSKGEMPLIKIEALKSKIFGLAVDKLQEFRNLALGIKEAISKESKTFLAQKAVAAVSKADPIVQSVKPANTVVDLFGQDHSYLWNAENPVQTAPLLPVPAPQIILRDPLEEKKSIEPKIHAEKTVSSDAPVQASAPLTILGEEALKKPQASLQNPDQGKSDLVKRPNNLSEIGAPLSVSEHKVLEGPQNPLRNSDQVEGASGEISKTLAEAAAPLSVPEHKVLEGPQNPLQNSDQVEGVSGEISKTLAEAAAPLSVSEHKVLEGSQNSSRNSDQVERPSGEIPKVLTEVAAPMSVPEQRVLEEPQKPLQTLGQGESASGKTPENLTEAQNPSQRLGYEKASVGEMLPDFSGILPSLESLDRAATKPKSPVQNDSRRKSAYNAISPDFSGILPPLESLEQVPGKKSQQEANLSQNLSKPPGPVKTQEQENKTKEVSAEDWLALLEQEIKSLITLMKYCEYPARGLRELVASIQNKAQNNKQDAKFLEESYKQLRALNFYVELKRTYEFFMLAAENTYANYPSFSAASNSAPENGNDEIRSVFESIRQKSIAWDEMHLEGIELMSKAMISNAGLVHTHIEILNKKSSGLSPKDLKKQKLLEDQLKNPPKNPIAKIFTFFSNLWHGIKPEAVKYNQGPAFRLEGAPINAHMLEVSKNLLNKLQPLNLLIQDNLNLPKSVSKPGPKQNSHTQSKKPNPGTVKSAAKIPTLAERQVEGLSRIVPVASLGIMSCIKTQCFELQKLRDSINALQLSEALQKSPDILFLKKMVPNISQQLGLEKKAELTLRENAQVENPKQVLDQLHAAIMAAKNLIQYAEYQKLYAKLKAFGWLAKDEIESLEKNPSFSTLNSIFDQWKSSTTSAPPIETSEAKKACKTLIPLLVEACKSASGKARLTQHFSDGVAQAALFGTKKQGLQDQKRPNDGPTAWVSGTTKVT